MRRLSNIIYLFTVALLCIELSAFAQSSNKTIEGIVLDSAGYAIKGVSVRLTSTMDTLITASTNSGFYQFKNVRGRDLTLTYSLLGHQIKYQKLPYLEALSKIYAPDVIMTPHSSLIKEVNVVKTIPVIYKQDTVQYNMSAFTFRKHELLEESLKQLPGIHVSRDGSVYSSGKLISSVQVDGKKFFGGDVLTATRNLPTDFISKIQIIDKYSEEGVSKGIQNKEPEKVINILLKEDKKRILFGQITTGAGTTERYLGSAGINRFNDGQELSVVASFNNTNTSLFSFGAPNGLGGRTQTLSDIGDFSDPIDGLNNISSIGVNFSDMFSDRTNISGGYSYTLKESFVEGFSKLTSNYVGNSINSLDNFENNGLDHLHKMFFEIDTRFKNKDILKISPTFSYNQTNHVNNKDRFLKSNKIINEGNYQDSVMMKTPNVELNLLYSKKFKNKKRRFVANAHVNAMSLQKDESVSDYYQIVDSSKTQPQISDFVQKQFLENRNSSNGAKVSLSYTEPFFEHSLLEITHDFDYTEISAVREVQDKALEEVIGYPIYVDSLGVDYEYTFRSNRTGINYQYEPNLRFRTNLGFAVQPLVMKGSTTLDNKDYKYESVNLIPSAGVRYRFTDEFDWQFNYQGNNNQPNFMQIMPMIDNSNSRFVIVGNPNLQAEFFHKISTTLRKSISTRSQYFESNFAYNFTNNKIVGSKRALENSTIQETTFKNADGYYELRGYYVFNTPLFNNDGLQLDINGNADYFNNISYIDEEKNTTKQILFSQTAQIRYTWSDYFESVFNTNYLLNNAVYKLPYSYSITANSFLLSLGTKGYLSDHITMGVEMSQKFHDGFNRDFMNVNPTIINAYLEFTFLKNKLALFRIQGFDLLDENKNMGIYSEYIGNDIYESRNNRLGRYFMVTLNMRLQRFPKDR